MVVIGIRALGAVLAAVVTALNHLIGASLALGLWCPRSQWTWALIWASFFDAYKC